MVDEEKVERVSVLENLLKQAFSLLRTSEPRSSVMSLEHIVAYRDAQKTWFSRYEKHVEPPRARA